MAAKSKRTDNEVEIEAPTDQWGNEVDQHRDRFPEDAPARSGKTTRPSGQGGSTPHDGISYQDQFPPNPEPSDTAKAWGEKVDELGPVGAAGDAIAQAAGRSSGKPNKGTGTATSSAPKNS